MKKILTIGLGLLVIVMAIPVVARALPPEGIGEGLRDFLYELEERVSFLDGGGTKVEWYCPPEAEWEVWFKSENLFTIVPVYKEGEGCKWQKTEIFPEARAIANIGGQKLYGVGSTRNMVFYFEPPLDLGESFQATFWLRWMGREKEIPNVTVVVP